MEFFCKLLAPITSDKLEAKGQILYRLSKAFMFLGACGFGLLLLISIVVSVLYSPSDLFRYVLVLNTSTRLAVLNICVNALVLIGYIGVLLGIAGIPMYFGGLNIFALGRIAHNTEKEASNTGSNANSQNNTTAQNGGWVCLCGKVNLPYYTSCSCGKTKGEAALAKAKLPKEEK